MRIINIFKRVGDSIVKYEYLAEVDLETDVTKYGTDSMEDRYKTDVFPLDVLTKATNFDMFQSEVTDCDFKWWKDIFSDDLERMQFSSKFVFRYLKIKLRKFINKKLGKLFR